MKDQAGHIKNPLTVISRFAAIAEISGTAVLPFISPENQSTYIWFLMIFPTLLVGTFFLTLNFNHKTLYAPSDYQNQNHFLNLFGIVTPDERDEKLNIEAQEANTPFIPVDDASPPDAATKAEAPVPMDAQPPSTPNPTEETSHADQIDQARASIDTPNVNREAEDEQEEYRPELKFDLIALEKRSAIEMKAKVDYLERRSIEKLRSATNIPFSEGVKFDIPGMRKPMIFDAVGDDGDTIHIAEIKYFTDNKFISARFHQTIISASVAAKHISNISNRKILLHLIVVLDTPASSGREQNFKVALRNMANNVEMNCKVYIVTTDELVSSSLPSSWIGNT